MAEGNPTEASARGSHLRSLSTSSFRRHLLAVELCHEPRLAQTTSRRGRLRGVPFRHAIEFELPAKPRTRKPNLHLSPYRHVNLWWSPTSSFASPCPIFLSHIFYPSAPSDPLPLHRIDFVPFQGICSLSSIPSNTVDSRLGFCCLSLAVAVGGDHGVGKGWMQPSLHKGRRGREAFDGLSPCAWDPDRPGRSCSGGARSGGLPGRREDQGADALLPSMSLIPPTFFLLSYPSPSFLLSQPSSTHQSLPSAPPPPSTQSDSSFCFPPSVPPHPTLFFSRLSPCPSPSIERAGTEGGSRESRR